MRLLQEYVAEFGEDPDETRQELGAELAAAQRGWDVIAGVDPIEGFQGFVERYNWLGDRENKERFEINQNLSRNLVGALMQDYLIHVVTKITEPYPELEIFTEVKVRFGQYPVWEHGVVNHRTPGHFIDVTVGYRFVGEDRVVPEDPWPRPAVRRLGAGEVVYPLVALNSKIRVSQPEFFDWVGREQLLTKGNPSCLSLQVALRAEMDLSIVELAQLTEQFFLVGAGGERAVVGNPERLAEMVEVISRHLEERMI